MYDDPDPGIRPATDLVERDFNCSVDDRLLPLDRVAARDRIGNGITEEAS